MSLFVHSVFYIFTCSVRLSVSQLIILVCLVFSFLPFTLAGPCNSKSAINANQNTSSAALAAISDHQSIDQQSGRSMDQCSRSEGLALLNETLQLPSVLSEVIESYLHLNLHPENKEVTDLYIRAMAGDKESQHRLGWKYDLDNSVKIERNDKEAFFWYERAALQKYPLSTYYLGLMYKGGVGVKKDPATALIHMLSAASEEHQCKRHNIREIGELYWHGNSGVTRNRKEACKWFRDAALLGSSASKYFLGHAYLSGSGVEQDGTEALKLFKEVDQTLGCNIPNAKRYIGLMHEKGLGGLTSDHSEAFKFFVTSASNGSFAANVDLAIFFAKGRVVTQDRDKAIYYIKKAKELVADLSSDNASLYLEEIGRIEEKNDAEVLGLIREALK